MSSTNLKFERLVDNDKLKEIFHPLFVQDYVRVEGYCMPQRYMQRADELLNFEVRDDDIYVFSFPKAGTTWTQEMIWCISKDVDLETAKRIPIQQRFPFLELETAFPYAELDNMFDDSTDPPKKLFYLPEDALHSIEYCRNMQGPRFMKTHLPFELMPRQLQTAQRKAKVVYVARDPRDACISYFHHYVLLHGYTGDLSSFVNYFLNDSVTWAPFWDHIMGFWNIRHQPNVLFITYEEMKRNLPAVMQKVANFLNKPLLTPVQVETLTHHLSFDSMKSNPAVNYGAIASAMKNLIGSDGNFMRSGKSGGFLKDLCKEEIEVFDAWCRKKLEGTDYVLPEYKEKYMFT